MFKHVEHNNFGMDEPIVNRLMVSVADIVDNVAGSNKKLADDIKHIYFNLISKELLDCRRAVNCITAHFNSLNMNNVYKYTPTYPELNRDIKTFLYTFKTALKNQINLLKLFYSSDLNDINEARWDKVIKKLEAKLDPLSIELIDCIKINMDWIERACQFRNDLEHTGNSLNVNNITLNSNGVIDKMKWGGQCKPKPNQSLTYDMYTIDDDMNYFIDSFILFSEHLVSICTNYKLIGDYINVMKINRYNNGIKLEPTEYLSHMIATA